MPEGKMAFVEVNSGKRPRPLLMAWHNCLEHEAFSVFTNDESQIGWI
jgi:hypothetical protein